MSGTGNTQGRVVGETAAAQVPAAGANPAVSAETGTEATLGTTILDGAQLVLDGLGLVPGVGEVADLANAGVSAARGDYVGAGMSLAAMIPFAGWGATVGKLGTKGMKEAAQRAEKELAQKAAKEKAEKEAREKLEKEAREKAEKDAAPKDTPEAENPDGAKVKGKAKTDKGKCGEWLARMDMMKDGFDDVMEVQNNSGHGVDLIGRNSQTGEVKVWEVKTTDGPQAPGLSKSQRTMGGEQFTESRVDRAATGYKNYAKSPTAMENGGKAMDWLEKSKKTIYEKREVFVDDLDKGCAKHPNRSSKSSPWIKKP